MFRASPGLNFVCRISVALLRGGAYDIVDCLNKPDYDHLLQAEVNSYPVEADGWDQGRSQQPIGMEHPCLALRKLLGDGTFYFSTEFDLTNRLQDR